ncbi:unnamed protein product [Chilo suppressalis]|uniref:15-hydroxyprostaglandin dehydrogenase [NAD(+)]-like n=1 Tax=Chilo suppressalis TaxID=168631 RepID=A0ABN8BA84_CHISP|nr:hypothetical protein evm_000569 [Chilo suppressalis]CAH0406625.1 unnamed protein product [Chilo suppressalis]
MHQVQGKVFLVTGGAAGIGEGVVRALVEEGSKHIAVLDLDEKGGKALESDLVTKHGTGKVKFYKCDITTDDLNAAFDDVIHNFAYIDGVINCAGILNDNPNVYAKAIAVNVTALITSSLKAYELMRKDRAGKGGTVINIASIAALSRAPFVPIYGATKIAVLHFSNALGMEPTYSRSGVRVLTVCFGCTDTTLLQSSKFGVFEPEQLGVLIKYIKEAPMQKPESAVRGMLEVFKKGESASTWLITADKPAEDITSYVNEAYKIMSRHHTNA